MDIFVIGSGVVGQATGMGLISKGHQATFYDIDASKLKTLEKAGNATTMDISGVKRADAVAVCVPTPARDHSLETAFLRTALSSAAPFIDGQVVLVRSTLAPGTMRSLTALVPEKDLVYNPEFLREVSAFEDFLNPDRVVLGAESEEAERKAEALYSWYEGPVVRTS